MTQQPQSYPIDSSAMLFLSQFAPDHTNVYRFTTALTQKVEPELLQQAVSRVYGRFPTIFARFRPKKREYTMVPMSAPPQVRPDPGFLLCMSREELEMSPFRLYYSGCHVILELFHGLTDGYGAITTLKALLGEYLYLKEGISTPERQILESSPEPEELRDAYPDHCGKKTAFLPRQQAYQLPGSQPFRLIQVSARQVCTGSLRAAARQWGVSVTTFLSELMAEAVLEVQEDLLGDKGTKPARIMVPIDLRRPFPSRTLRNFVLYALPTLTKAQLSLPLGERFRHFQDQLLAQFDKSLLQGQLTRNVRLLQHPVFLALPLDVKCGVTRLSNRLFGETNSSITLTNLGPVVLSEALQSRVAWIQTDLTPRVCSPYNCGLITCGDITTISLTRFGTQDVLGPRFFTKLDSLLDSQ